MGWFSKPGLSETERPQALELIRHLQKVYAYQQLGMERYNDAVAAAGGVGTPTNEGFTPPDILLSDPSAVSDLVLPAVREKLQILATADDEHRSFPIPTTKVMAAAYSEFTAHLTVLRRRSELQAIGWEAWTSKPTLEGSVVGSQLASDEWAAMTQSGQSLNKLIAEAGLTSDALMNLKCAVFNEVRATLGLPLFDVEEFGMRFVGGLSGLPARFFSD